MKLQQSHKQKNISIISNLVAQYTEKEKRSQKKKHENTPFSIFRDFRINIMKECINFINQIISMSRVLIPFINFC
jgi:hypothetical protein